MVLPVAVDPTAPGLHVSGKQLLESNGNAFVMRGINVPHAWYPDNTASALNDIAQTGANSVRIVLASGERWSETSESEVSNLIEQAKANNLIAVLEVHDTTGYGEQSGAATLSQAVDYWKSIKAALIGQEDYTVINIGNEPFGNGQSASAWIDGHIEAIQALRDAGFNHAIMVDAPNWGQDWENIMRDSASSVLTADPLQNVVFSVHMYQVYQDANTISDYMSAFIQNELALVVGEFGADHQGEEVDEASVMGYAEQYGYGYLGWSWSGNSGGTESLDIVQDFDASRLSSWGETLINGDNGIRATSSTATVFGSNPADDNSGESSLKSLAAFPIGVAVNAGNENNSIIDSDTSSQQQAVVFRHFNQLTAGNIMKMSYLHPTENSFTFDQGDELVSLANDNGMSVHGHTLIWHSDYQLPDFMKNYNGDFGAMLKNHVQTIVSHYAGKVASWDVVNEALADNNENEAINGFRNSIFYQRMGSEYIDEAFIYAHEADPDADLFYNDYSIENGDSKTENMLSLIDGMKSRGVPITGVGFQMHVLSGWPSISVIENAMRSVADRGLKVKITELDVRVNNPYDDSAPVYTSLTQEAAEIQKERYRQIVAAYLRAVPPELRAGITVWGVWDADSWLNTPEQPDWPLLFDDDFQPKPALQGFADGLTGE
jgi:GH35 family endo-1,4-beta-xylanase